MGRGGSQPGNQPGQSVNRARDLRDAIVCHGRGGVSVSACRQRFHEIGAQLLELCLCFFYSVHVVIETFTRATLPAVFVMMSSPPPGAAPVDAIVIVLDATDAVQLIGLTRQPA